MAEATGQKGYVTALAPQEGLCSWPLKEREARMKTKEGAACYYGP